ncbi:MAG: hypothetical protein D6776_02000 [Planctomycetota bacterium]|nr:MAG: hypothetical protein D6776_02000 [Planctomycetota bacterium]
MRRKGTALLRVAAAVLAHGAARAAETAHEAGAHAEGAHHGLSPDALIVQFLGFAILVVVLVVWVFPVIGKALRARSERIERGFGELEDRQRTAREQLEQTERELAQIEARSLERMQQAEAEGIRLRDELVREGEQAARRIVERGQVEAHIERAKMVLDLRNEVVEICFAAAERVVAQQIGEAEQAALLERFFQELEGMKV